MSDKKREKRVFTKYPRELKLKACQDVLSGRLTAAEAKEKYGIKSSASIPMWMYHLGLKGNHKERPVGKITRYPESFKREVCRQVLSKKMSKNEAYRVYGLSSATNVTYWIKKYYPVVPSKIKTEQIVSKFASMRSSVKSKGKKLSEIHQENQRLKKELEQALLASEVYATIIEMASEELGFDIRKKFNTKQ